MATITSIQCDGCGRMSQEQWKNVGNAVWSCRSGLNEKGWQANHGTRKDYCPRCVAAGKAPKKRPRLKSR